MNNGHGLKTILLPTAFGGKSGYPTDADLQRAIAENGQLVIDALDEGYELWLHEYIEIGVLIVLIKKPLS